MKNYLLFLTIPLLALNNSCSQADLTQLANTMLSEATGGVLQMKEGIQGSGNTAPTATVKPSRVKLSRSGSITKINWKGNTPYADLGDESGPSQGYYENGYWHFSPPQYRMLTISIDFNKKRYKKVDLGTNENESGTVTFL